jgi:hypothetical protein
MKNNKINWTYRGSEVINIDQTPEEAIGFIYKITNLTNGMYYYGRKTLLSISKKKLTLKEKKLPENFRKTFKIIKKESTWKSYCGSSKTLLEDLKNGDNYSKEIIEYCNTKALMTLKETTQIVCSGSLLDIKSYNMWVSAKIYKKHLI